MTKADPRVVLGPALSAALDKKGYTELTAVQLAVLDPALEGPDPRLSSQTGSGKTVAIGFTLRGHLDGETEARSGIARPRAFVVTPTRELAKQVEAELAWLFEGLEKRVASVIGGASYRDERRALAASPAVVVGTPGRLLDHLERGGIDPELVGVVVLDEADRMLDLGFREELEAILGRVPEGHRTHLVSATFPREVRALADRVQRDAVRLEGTRLGEANADIEHVVHLVDPDERLDAVVNLLAAAPDARTLVFARTRADVSHFAGELSEAGFPVGALSGEMEQRERNRALSAFKRGQLRALVATDVAARGIDVHDVSEVIHLEIPNDADAYTHRSGRTGRAGRKGRSAILATIGELAMVKRILERARVSFRFAPIPTAEEISLKVDDRIVAALTAEEPPGEEDEAPDARMKALARRLVDAGDPARVIERLLVRSGAGQTVPPRTLTPVEVPRELPRPARVGRHPRDRRHEGSLEARGASSFEARGASSSEARGGSSREERGASSREAGASPSYPPPRGKGPFVGDEREAPRGWALFDVTWGDLHGADARRLLALVCRRGNIRGSDVGAIRVGRTSSQVEVATDVAESFARSAGEPDPRDPRVRIRDARTAGQSQRPPPLEASPWAPRGAAARSAPPSHRPPRNAPHTEVPPREGARPPSSYLPPEADLAAGRSRSGARREKAARTEPARAWTKGARGDAPPGKAGPRPSAREALADEPKVPARAPREKGAPPKRAHAKGPAPKGKPKPHRGR